MLVDLKGLLVLRSKTAETTALVTALLAGLHGGVINVSAHIQKSLQIERILIRGTVLSNRKPV